MRATTLIVTLALTMATAAGAHDDDHPTHIPSESDPAAFREFLMENVGENARALKKKIGAGQVKEAAVNARAIALHATRIAALFPEGSGGGSTRAKPEIWKEWPRFVAMADELRDRADALGTAATGGATVEQARAGLKKLFGACKSCHDPFRVPDDD